MRDLAKSPVGIQYLLQSGTAVVEQMRDRLASNANMISRITPESGVEAFVELTADEELLISANADRVPALLRKLAERPA